MDYVRDTMDWLMGKGRRKVEKEAPSSDGTPGPPYLDPARAKFPSQFVTPALLPAYVRLPHGVDQDEWLATHTISFFEHVNLLYSCLSEYCNVTDCSSMNGPQQSQYYWVDEKGKKTKTPAACYVDFVMTFVHKLITDESVFPTKYGNTFPANFLSLVKRAWRYLFHVIAHIYASHFLQIYTLQLHSHLHTIFVHFSVFNKEFGLVEEEETRVLDDLLDLLLSQGMCGSAGALPPLTTSQSDSALHNRTRVDASPAASGGNDDDDAWSLPPTGVSTGLATTTTTTTSSTTALFPPSPLHLAGGGGGCSSSTSSPLVGSAPAQYGLDAAVAAAAAAGVAPRTGADVSMPTPLLGAEAASGAAAVETSMDDSLDARLYSSSPTSASLSRTGVTPSQPCARRPPGEEENDEDDDVGVNVMGMSPGGGGGDGGSRRRLPSSEFRVSPSPPRLSSSLKSEQQQQQRPPLLPTSPSDHTRGDDDDVDDSDATKTTTTTTTLPAPSSSTSPSRNSFMRHRAQTSGTSEENVSHHDKSRSSSGHSHLSGVAGGAAASTTAMLSTASTTATADNPFALLTPAGTEDKENLSPMADLSVSAEGNAAMMMMVESMEVVVTDLEDS